MIPVTNCDQCGSNATGAADGSGDPMLSFVDADSNILVDEMNGLSVRERELIYEEVHGVASIVDETPAFVVKKVNAMHDELAKIPKRQRKALDRVFFLRPSLQSDQKHLMIFLRATRFDPIKAAALICRHYEHKMMLFGESKFVRSITVDDLNEAEQALFSTGPCMLLPSNDRVGRGVYLMHVSQYDFRDWRTTLRFAWYQIMSVLEENEEMQKRGVVQIIVFYEWKEFSTTKVLDLLWRITNIVRDWPFRSCGLHFCYDNRSMRSLLDFIHVVMGKDLRLRQRCHFGTKLETRLSLLTYGIEVANCLTPGEGLLSVESLRSHLEHRRKKEADSQQMRDKKISITELREYPGNFDVLMGRGKPFLGWEGNVRLTQLIRKNTDEYMENRINRVDKTMIAMKIVQIIQINGGRFIQRTDHGWKTVDDQTAKEKVSQGLRAEVRWRTSGPSDIQTIPLSYSIKGEDFVQKEKRPRTLG